MTLLTTSIAIFTCPSNGYQTVEDVVYEGLGIPAGVGLATTDYAYSRGATDSWCVTNEIPEDENDPFNALVVGLATPIKLSQITDGTSRTFAMGEASGGEEWQLCPRPGCSVAEGRSRANVAWMVGNVGSPTMIAGGFPFSGVYGTTVEPLNKSPVTSTFVEETALGDCRSSIDGGPHGTSNFRSDHPTGGHFLHCDGSVLYVEQSIDITIYRGLATIAGEEITEAR